MSRVPHDLLLKFRDAELSEKNLEQFAADVRRETGIDTNPATLGMWIPQLPKRGQLEKIHDRLHETVHTAGATLKQLCWQTIPIQQDGVHVHLNLFFKHHVQLHLILNWKRRRLDVWEIKKLPALPTGSSWGFCRSAPGGWRYDLTAEVWEQAVEALAALLNAEQLPELPRGANRRCFTDPEPSDMPTPAA